MTAAQIREAHQGLEVIAYHEREIEGHRRRIAAHEEQIQLERDKVEQLKGRRGLPGKARPDPQVATLGARGRDRTGDEPADEGSAHRDRLAGSVDDKSPT